MAGLEAQHKGSKPRTATPAVQGRTYRKVQQQAKDGSTHWPVRKWAAEIRVAVPNSELLAQYLVLLAKVINGL